MKRYITSGIIISLLFPLFTWFIPIVNIFVSILYVYPLLVISWLFGNINVWIKQSMFGYTPSGVGWYIEIISIILIGFVSGYLLYFERKIAYRKKGLEIPRKVGFSGFFVIATFQVFILIIITFCFGPKIQYEQELKSALEKQKYVQENCQRIDDGARHYYSCKNPDQLILDTSFESVIK